MADNGVLIKGSCGDLLARRKQVAEWTDELARGHMTLGQPEEALAAFRRAVELEPRNRSALRHVADLSMQRFPQDAISAHLSLLEMTPPAPESLHALAGLFQGLGKTDAAARDTQ